MYLRYSFLLVLLLISSSALLAQKQNNIWYFGYKAGIDFNGSTPVALTDGSIIDIEGCASIADPTTGKLLFYTNGDSVWNRRHQLMPNGTGLGAHWSSTQGALIIPMPGTATMYYVFTSDAADNLGRNGINYSIVNMSLNGGLGDVDTNFKKIGLTAPASEKLCGVRHCNGRDYWVLTHDNRNKLLAYAVTPSGISGPITSTTHTLPTGGSGWRIGYLKATPDRRHLAAVDFDNRRVNLYEFDNATGIASRGISIPVSTPGNYPYGVAFSSDNTKLYVSIGAVSEPSPRIVQYDISRYDSASIVASRYVVVQGNVSDYFGSLHLGPDGKIYCLDGNVSTLILDTVLSVIEQPNAAGSACNFRHDSFSLLSGIGYYGLPNTVEPMQAFVAGGDTTICAGQRVILQASGGDRYQWFPSSSLSCDTCPITTATPIQTTTYRAITRGGTACEAMDSVVVVVLPRPRITVIGDSSVCSGGSVTLQASGAQRYQWRSSQPLGCDTCASVTLSPSRTATYTLIGVSAQGCIDSTVVQVTVRDSFKVDAGSNITICAGDSVTLTPDSQGTFNWSPDEGLSCTTCRNPVARPKRTILYTVRVTDSMGCSGSDTVRVTVSDFVPKVDAGKDVVICSGDTAILSGAGGGTYRWTPGDGLSCDDCRNPGAFPDTTTTYHLTVTNSTGCTTSDSVTVTVLALPDVDAGSDVAICSGDSTKLHATGGTSYRWSPADHLSCTNCADPVANPEGTTIYYLTTANGQGCEASDSVTVTVIDIASVDAGTSLTICSGDSTQLHASNGVSWEWTPSNGLSCTDCRNPIASPSATTLYTVKVSGPGGCFGFDTVSVTVLPLPAIMAGEDVRICIGETTQLHASGGAVYRWSPSNGLSCDDCADPIAGPSATTLYIVTASDPVGCSGSDTVSVTVLPMPAITAGEDVEICIGETTQLHASGGVAYRWSPSDGLSCDDCADPIASPSGTTTYTVVGRSSDGCTASDDVMITVGKGRRVSAHIERNHHLLPGSSTTVPVILDQPIVNSIDTMIFSLGYNRGMLRLRRVETAGMSLDGWQREVIVDTIGGIALRFVASGGARSVNVGPLLSLGFEGYIGDTVTSELRFNIVLPNQACGSVAATAGRIILDSRCGLSYRMIEIDTNRYVLKSPRPNPFNPATVIEFSLGLDGATRLEVLNAAGERVAVLVDEYMQPGGYAVTWDAGAMPSGLYYVRLTSGVWMETQSMVLVK
jgi:hypothetical protein